LSLFFCVTTSICNNPLFITLCFAFLRQQRRFWRAKDKMEKTLLSAVSKHRIVRAKHAARNSFLLKITAFAL